MEGRLGEDGNSGYPWDQWQRSAGGHILTGKSVKCTNMQCILADYGINHLGAHLIKKCITALSNNLKLNSGIPCRISTNKYIEAGCIFLMHVLYNLPLTAFYITDNIQIS